MSNDSRPRIILSTSRLKSNIFHLDWKQRSEGRKGGTKRGMEKWTGEGSEDISPMIVHISICCCENFTTRLEPGKIGEGKKGRGEAGRRKGGRVGHSKGGEGERVYNEKGRVTMLSNSWLFISAAEGDRVLSTPMYTFKSNNVLCTSHQLCLTYGINDGFHFRYVRLRGCDTGYPCHVCLLCRFSLLLTCVGCVRDGR